MTLLPPLSEVVNREPAKSLMGIPSWGYGANAVGRYFPYDKETCTECGRSIPKGDSPSYFELDRVLCGKCLSVREGGGS